MNEKCEHRKHKRNYPFGKKSKALIHCKICGEKLDGKFFINVKKEKRNKFCPSGTEKFGGRR